MKFRQLPLFTLLVTLVLTGACNNTSSEGDIQDARSNKTHADEKALALLHNNCFACHTPDMTTVKRLAPPIFKVREHYLSAGMEKTAFVRSIVDYASNPSEDKSIMPGAVRNFGLMPKTMVSEEDLILIASYIYDNDLSSDKWYALWEDFRGKHNPVVTDLSFEDMGRNYAGATKTELGKNLLAAIKENGTAGAVAFCNTKAIHLTDSMSKVFNTSIKRVSDKPRNPENRANAVELEFIETLKQKLARNEKLIPLITEKNGKMVGYYAIETNIMCLQCHGIKGKDILPETVSIIDKLYPEDEATGYAENQVRGIFVVEMTKK